MYGEYERPHPVDPDNLASFINVFNYDTNMGVNHGNSVTAWGPFYLNTVGSIDVARRGGRTRKIKGKKRSSKRKRSNKRKRTMRRRR